MKKKKLRCYIYVRVSTSMQVDGYSLEAQRERLIKFAEFQEMEVVREYCDAGKSGKNISGRPEFSQMLQDIAEDRDEVDFILVFKLSRFGRNAADVLNSLQYIQDFGVNLICVEDGIDSSKDSGKLTITVLSAVAEIERENILVQTMEGRRQKAREGKWNGGQAPFGYELDSKNGTLTVNPKEAEIVRIIFSKFVNEGLGADSICDYLNQHGYQKKKVKKNELNYFSRGFIMKILDNPVYIGKIAYGRIATEKVKGSKDAVLSHKEGVDVIPSNKLLTGMDMSLLTVEDREMVLKEYLELLEEDYDYIIVDCMPSLGMLTINALSAAHSVLIPVQPQYYAADGLMELLKVVKGIKQRFNPKLEIEGILFTMDSSRYNNSKRNKQAVKNAYGDEMRIFEDSIPRSEALAETASEGVSIFSYDIRSKGAESYEKLAQEVLNHA